MTRYLLDEMLSEDLAPTLRTFGVSQGDDFQHIRELGHGGAADADIPALCRDSGASVLISMNVRDFGAKKFYYEALLASEIHVVVIRPGKQQPNVGQQLGLIFMHFSIVTELIRTAPSVVLIRVTHSGAHRRSLPELIEEINGRLP